MVVKNISLQYFRNFEKINLELSDGINILYGLNAQGKTNFIESVYFCATGRSHRTNYDRELIKFAQNEAHIQIYVQKDSLTDRIDVHIKKEGKKGIAVNGIAVKRLGELFGVLLTVIFSPEDLQLVKAGPSERRRFMDMEICQLSPVYYYELQQYYKILKQRNGLLKDIQKKNELKETLFVWDEQLVGHGVKIMKYRADFINKINKLSSGIHRKITDGAEKMEVIYKPGVKPQEFLEKLNKYAERDMAQGVTSVGVHKDDLNFQINGQDTRIYGSQGQQRTVSLSLKLAEIDLIKEEKGETPVLLLDDVLSELDKTRQNCLLESINGVQTVITCTGMEDMLSRLKKHNKINVFCVEKGRISLIK